MVAPYMAQNSGCYTSQFLTVFLESPTELYLPWLRFTFQNSKNVSNIKISSKYSPTWFYRSGLAGMNDRVSGQNNYTCLEGQGSGPANWDLYLVKALA